MNYIFDTNVFRRASENDSLMAQLFDLKKRLGANERCFVCELTLLELNSQLRRDGSLRYEQRKAGMLFARDLTDGRILPLPDYFLRSRFFKSATIQDISNYRLEWDIYWRHLEASRSITSFKRKPSVSSDRSLKRERISVNSWAISRVREDFEVSYVRSMGLNVAPISGAAYAKHRDDSSDPLWRNVQLLVRSPDFEWEVYKAIADRCGVRLFGERSAHDSANIAALCAFMVAYKWVLNKMIESNYNYAKNKNDYIDIHLLPYLADENVTLVTLDTKLKTKIAACSEQASRVLSIDELASSR